MPNPGSWLGAALALLLVTVPAVAGETPSDIDAIREALLSNKRSLVETNLGLDDEEAKAFWPLYDEYEADMKGVQGRLAAVVAEYAASHDSITDAQAANLTAAYLLADEDRATFRRAYLADFARVLPGKKLARFYQLENKLDAAVRVQLADRIPLIGP